MADTILVVAEQRQGELNRQSWETLVAGQQLAASRQASLAVALPGKGMEALAQELAAKKPEEVWLVEHDLLEQYTPDGYTAALEQLIRQLQPALVLFPHTYQVRDFAPKLAARFQRSFISDCIGLQADADQATLVRQMFQGKTNADVVPQGEPPCFVSFQAAAFRADQVAQGSGRGEVKKAEIELSADQVRSKPEEPFREAKQAVDLSQADIVVAVGRGIKEKENLQLGEKLAKLLGGEVAASRPICDEGWLPMERQIGSSGQTVAPKLYLALGISGAIQHVVGMKGARTIVAINKDKDAPIFEIADYGIAGDLFEIVPALIEILEKGEAS